jgi:hypothetical protein
MNPEIDGVCQLLRTLAEVRDGAFYSLWIALTHRVKHPVPEIGFRIYQVADADDAYLVIGVTATRKDLRDITWSVALQTARDCLRVEATIEVTDDDGSHELFARQATVATPYAASETVRAYATEICHQIKWFDGELDLRAEG